MSNKEKVRVDPRIIRTKRMFKVALTSLLQENNDLSKVTVQKLAERAELNRATFYLHYQDIEDLMEQMVNEVLGELSQKISLVSEENQPPIVPFLEHLYEHAALFKVMLENKDFRFRLFDIIKDIVSVRREKRRAKENSSQVPIEIIVSSTFGIVSWWIQEGTPYSPNYLAKQINIMFKRNTDAKG